MTHQPSWQRGSGSRLPLNLPLGQTARSAVAAPPKHDRIPRSLSIIECLEYVNLLIVDTKICQLPSSIGILPLFARVDSPVS